jgi:2-polyprenyl-3-methyl-5-hydroxy-6-metoxy-1,4-benzoquinol methylase
MQRASLQTIQTRYRNREVVGKYDKRYNDLEGRLNYATMRQALHKALAHVPTGGQVLDIPCGTGIFTWYLSRLGYKTVASDISMEMIDAARTLKREANVIPPVFFEGDIFRLPFTDRAFNAVVCMRFMNLVDRPTRIRAVQEMARVADVLIVSYYHKYTFKYASRVVRHRLGLRKPPNPRLSRNSLLQEINETGLQLRRLITVAPMLSEAWIAVLEHPASSDATA